MNIRDRGAENCANLERKLRSTASPWDQLPILLELTKEQSIRNPAYPLQCANEALGLSQELNAPYWIACSRKALGVLLLQAMRYAEATSHLEEAVRIFGEINELQMKRRAELSIGDIHISTGELEKGLTLILQCRHFFEMTNDAEWRAFSFRSLGNFYKMTGEHAETIECFRKAISIALKANLRAELPGLYMHLAEGYKLVELKSREWKYLMKSFALARENGDVRGVATAIGNATVFFLIHSQVDRAEKCARWSIGLSRALGHANHQGMSWSMLGTIYRNKNDFPRALRCLKKALPLVRIGQNPLSRGKVYEEIGLVYVAMGEYRRGLNMLRKGLKLIERSGHQLYILVAHHWLAQSCEKAGDTEGTLYHFKEHARLEDDYLSTQKFLEASRAEQQRSLQKLKQRLEKTLSQNTMLADQVKGKEAEIVDLTRQLIREEKGISTLHPNESDKKFSEGTRVNRSENWEIFARRFHGIHQGFYSTLIRSYPELTPTEVKVCSLIRIGLSTKEAASILGITKRTVDNHRVRIHKKMDLPPGASLSGFIIRM